MLHLCSAEVVGAVTLFLVPDRHQLLYGSIRSGSSGGMK